MTPPQAFRNTLVVIATLLAAYMVYRSMHILVVLLIAIIIALAVRPAVMWLKRHRVSYGLSILIVYLGVALALFIISALVIPPITSRLSDYIGDNQRLANRIIDTQTWIENEATRITGSQVKLFDPAQIRTTVSTTVQRIISALPSIAGEFGSLLADFILVVVMGIYWLSERDKTIEFLLKLFPIGKRGVIKTIVDETEASLSIYLRGVVLVASFVGIANFLLLTLLRVPDALMLGFIMGITTMLPVVGGYVGAGLSTLLALLISPLSGLFAFGSFVLVQQVENHYLTPRVMSRSVGLNPILIIVSLFVGADLGGVIGALIAVPIAGTLNIVLRHLVIDPRTNESVPHMVEGGLLLESSRAPSPKGDLIIETTR